MMNRSMVLCLLAAVSSGCLDRELTPINPCLVSTVSRKVTVTGINKVDLLFMVDNSASMTSKQNSLKAQFPRMIQVLSTGMRTGNDPYPFPPVRDMHLAVVSSDMGVVGQSGIMGCDPNGGDDGRLQYTSSGDPGCQASYPPFLSYDATRDNPMQIGVDFECIASLGSLGYNYENQLESAFKALRNSRCPDRSRRRPRPARNERGGVNCKVAQHCAKWRRLVLRYVFIRGDGGVSAQSSAARKFHRKCHARGRNGREARVPERGAESAGHAHRSQREGRPTSDRQRLQQRDAEQRQSGVGKRRLRRAARRRHNCPAWRDAGN
jgi:hypothetical protein